MKEFGDNPWADTVGQKEAEKEGIDDDDFGDFEAPDSQTYVEKKSLQSPGNNEATYPLIGLTGGGELVDLSDGSSNRIGSLPPQESATVAKSHESQSLSERHAESQLTPIDVSYSQVQEAPIISGISSSPRKLEDQDWDEFVECSIPSYADESSTQERGLNTPALVSNQQATEPSNPSSSSLEPLKDDTTLFMRSGNTERPQSSKLVKGNLGPPPSNIPPPSILLLLIQTMLQSLTADIKKILSLTDASSISLGQSKVDQLQSHLSIVRAAARIIAGRKLRWKRDTHLSQSMKIGPAHSGKIGGMKLTGVDRTESLREDREVAEALGIWKKQLGGLRAAITTANAGTRETVLSVPEISENLHVRGARLEEGALTAPKCCFVCGLKREERLEKIDVEVEDSFGEWWVDHWGHVDCRIFWEKHRGSLGQRR